MNLIDQRYKIHFKTSLMAVCLTLLTAIWITVIIPTAAEAKSRTCLRLEHQLASLSSGSRTANPLKKLRYNRAIKRQKDHVKQTNRQLRRGGCLKGKARKPQRGLSCRNLKRSLKKMNANLKVLRAKRDNNSSKGGSSNSERRRVSKAMKANRCNERRSIIASNRSGVVIERSFRRRTVIDQVFGDDRRNREKRIWEQREWERQNDYREYYDDEQGYPGTYLPYGRTYRTLCVRTCDGYYFPISFSTTEQNFDRDVETCSANCPGTETELYFHSTNGEDSEDMISVYTHQPYTELATAFNFRTAVSPECGCNFTQVNYEAIAGDGSDNEAEPVEQALGIPTPTFKIDPGEDPDTLANLRGNFVPKPSKAGQSKLTKSGKRKIRVVGEAFFPGQ
jgi:hypothetical protein